MVDLDKPVLDFTLFKRKILLLIKNVHERLGFLQVVSWN